MDEPLPREPNPENIPIAVTPHGPLTLTTRSYLLLGAGAVIVLMMAYGSCHRAPEPYGPRLASAGQGPVKEESKADKAKREYEEWLKIRQQAENDRKRDSLSDATPTAAPQKSARQLQAEDLGKRLHEAAYAVPLVTDAPSKRSDDRTTTKDTESGPSAIAESVKVADSGIRNAITLPAGTIFNAETVNMLDGSNVGPLVAMLTRDVYAPGSQRVVVPQGAKLFGEAAKVGSFDQERLSVVFHRLAITRTHTVSLDKLPGLDQEGATGLHDQVNRHYAQIFGVSMAIGALGGLAQIGNGSYGGLNGYDSTTQLRNGITNSFATSSSQVLSRFLQRMPTVRIRPGQRVDILLTDDLKIPDVLE